jgi:predicted transcriptional regulator
MSIHPRYADAIMDGAKGVEFRKRALAGDISTVLVYATAPVGRLVGTFQLSDTMTAKPRDLWREFAAVGCIEQDAFDAYYLDRDTGVGLLVASPRRFDFPVRLEQLVPSPRPPQSFVYIPTKVLAQAIEAGEGPTGSNWFESIADLALSPVRWVADLVGNQLRPQAHGLE